MADNVTLDPGAGGADVATDDVGGVHYQRFKLDGGGDGLAVPIVAGRQADAASVPVALSTENVALLDGIETLIGTTNTTLTTIDGRVDGLETLITSTNAKLDTENTNSAAIAASASVLDDWDETDRAKVNIIVGQAGVAAGAGAVGATVLRVTLASDDPVVALLAPPSTGTKSNVSGSASSVTILASNSLRRGATIYNDSSAILYLDLSGGTASSTSFSLAMAANSFYELPEGKRGVYTGAITGIWASATGAARVTEFT